MRYAWYWWQSHFNGEVRGWFLAMVWAVAVMAVWAS